MDKEERRLVRNRWFNKKSENFGAKLLELRDLAQEHELFPRLEKVILMLENKLAEDDEGDEESNGEQEDEDKGVVPHRVKLTRIRQTQKIRNRELWPRAAFCD
jgi:hypothetical protein